MSRRKIGQILWLALEYAKQDRQTLIDAYGGDMTQDPVMDARQDIDDFKRLQLRLFGTTRSELQARLDQMKPVNILRLLDKTLEDR